MENPVKNPTHVSKVLEPLVNETYERLLEYRAKRIRELEMQIQTMKVHSDVTKDITDKLYEDRARLVLFLHDVVYGCGESNTVREAKRLLKELGEL